MSKSTMLFNGIDRELRAAGKHTDDAMIAQYVLTARRYRRLLVEQIGKDLQLPPHVVPEFGMPLLLTCRHCGQELAPQTVADVGDFADQHWHGPAWRCDDCGKYEWLDACRYCEHERGGAPAIHEGVIVHQQLVVYVIRLQGHNTAYVNAPSLLRARRAARGMYPKAGGLTVASDIAEWTAQYGNRSEL